MVKKDKLFEVAIKKAQWFRKNPRKSEVKVSEGLQPSTRKKQQTEAKNNQKATVKLPDIKR